MSIARLIVPALLLVCSAMAGSTAKEQLTGRWFVRYDDGNETVLDLSSHPAAVLIVSGVPDRAGTWELLPGEVPAFRLTLPGDPVLVLEGRLGADGTLSLAAPEHGGGTLQMHRKPISAASATK